jgi:hypothetical protein
MYYTHAYIYIYIYSLYTHTHTHTEPVVLDGLVVSVLAIGPKVCGLKPSRGRWTFKDDKISSTPSFVGEVKPSASCCKILRYVKEPFGV